MSERERFKYNTVRAVERALDILEFMTGGNYLSLAQISGAVKLHKSTVFHSLTTLMVRGYVEQERESGNYRLSTKLYKLGRKTLEQRNLRSEADPYLRNLRETIQEKVFLVAVHGQEVTSLGEENPGIITNAEELDIYQIVLAGVNRLRYLLEKPQDDPNQVTKIVLTQGFYIDDGGDTDGFRTVMAPIRNHLGLIMAILCVVGRNNQLPMARIMELGKLLKQISSEISGNLGFEGTEWRI